MNEFFLYRCEKCGNQSGGAELDISMMRCGAVVEYVEADNPDANDDKFVSSLGIKPIGCGGIFKKITLEEAMDYVEKD
jgi:hypothetical protein